MNRDLQFLLDIMQSAKLIMDYTAQCSKNEFIKNVQLQDLVIRRLLVIAEIRRLLVIAEAARRVSALKRQTLPNISYTTSGGWWAILLNFPPYE